MRNSLVLSLVIAALVCGRHARAEDSEVDDSPAATHDCARGCAAFLHLRIERFEPTGPDAPPSVRVFAGGNEVLAGADGAYRIPLTDADGDWIRDPFHLAHIQANGIPPGAVLAVRLGHGRLLQGLYGYMRDGKVATRIVATVIGARILRVRNYRRDRFEHQGDGIAILGDDSQDEFTRAIGSNVVEEMTTAALPALLARSAGW
jgi:hypothetical protein